MQIWNTKYPSVKASQSKRIKSDKNYENITLSPKQTKNEGGKKNKKAGKMGEDQENSKVAKITYNKQKDSNYQLTLMTSY